MLIAVPREVEHAGTQCSKMQNLLCQKTRQHPHKQSRISKDSPWIILKRVLDPLTMMYIPVNYQDPGEKTDINKYMRTELIQQQKKKNSCYLFTPYFCFAYRAAMATLLNTQKPLAALRILWCPGGL